MLTFTLSDEEEEKVDAWLKEVNLRAVAKQKEEIENPGEHFLFCWENGVPYTGTIGGGVTYSFTATGLGYIVTVQEAITGEKLDITDYDMW